MRIRSFEELMLLPEDLAVARHFDGVTWRRARWFLGGYLLAAFVTSIVFASTHRDFRLWVSLADLALLVAFFAARRTRAVEDAFRPALAGLVAVQFLVTALWATDTEMVLVFALVPFPALLLLTRFRVREAAFVVAALGAGTAGWELAHEAAVAHASLLGFLALGPGTAAAVAASRFAAREKKEFLDRWHRAVSRERERIRLRGELADARKIQLSMLPAGEPRIGWLDLSGACLPAAEVGGDYYDYIRLDDDAWALVVADVAGHGVGSGLLIAGLRSSLYVLQEELRTPAAVLERLNAMVQASVRVRTFVTVTIAVIERSPGDGTGRLRVASAGHPPALLWRRAEGRVVEVGRPAPPLGTRLPTRYEEETVALAPGDLTLLYTDGLVEATDHRIECYGFERLERALARTAGSGDAREVRSHLLEDVSHFKGEILQGDDLSLVVARYRAIPG
jgi:serine phosphatase RsbU (regulator of sigma subunit)